MKRVHVLFLIMIALGLIGAADNLRRNVIPNLKNETPPPASNSEEIAKVNTTIKAVMQNETQLSEDVHRDFWKSLDTAWGNEQEANRYASEISSTSVFFQEYQLELFRSAKLSAQSREILKTERFLVLAQQAKKFEGATPTLLAKADEFLDSAANQTPMTGSDGNPVIITKDLIEQGLLALEASFGRLRQLLNREWRSENSGRGL